MDWATLIAAMIAAIVSLILLLVNGTITLREHAFTRFTTAMTWLASSNEFLVARGVQVLRDQSASRWISNEDKDAAEQALADLQARVERRIRSEGGSAHG
ncbi:hypothetical protein ACDF64_10005 [Agromyces sp. MMS24-JH15]|uniref:hypothetical protein n=1 Tax=Agromyces sp. MMS24-JH15 TaxID=3243765 RepID=UPI0037492F90